jgi:type IV fimbrial biogenesis protein FimT
MSVAAILISIGIPSFQSLIKDKRIITVTESLRADLELAKSEAMARNRTVIMCRPNPALTACQVNANADWKDGWLIFVDLDGDNVIDTAEILRVTEVPTGDLKVEFAPAQISFNSRGFTPTSNGTFMACDRRGWQHGANLVLSTTGSLTNQKPASATDCPVP